VTEAFRPVSIKDLVERIREIREGLEHTLMRLRERISLLETDRAGLLLEVERLKKVAESQAGALEIEVSELRKEIRVLKEILGPAE
jgi:predicted  nucleic acid-binding Zn-ribbon protein